MASLSNYRLKINLSKFYNDQRKLSYIYVDTAKITNVYQLHNKISHLFGISRFFHLITEENIFLPLNEDIRIINENDILTIQPEVSDSVKATDPPSTENFSYVVETPQTQDNLVKSKKRTTSTAEYQNQSDTSSDDADNDETNTDSKMVKSVNGVQKKYSVTEIVNSSNFTQKKRKRVRRKRAKTVEKESLQTNGNSINTNCQPVNIRHNNTFTNTSTPKHLKFSWEDETNEKEEQISENSIKHSRESKPIIRSNEPADLSTLLSFKNNKFPLRFISKKVKHNSGAYLPKSPPVKSNSPAKIEDTQIQADSSVNNCTDPIEENFDYSKVNPLDYPAHTSGFEVDDIVAFRTLKIGEDYSPTVSGYIIAKTISKDCAQNNYTFKILEGHDQVKIPDGKFSLPNDEENEREDKKLDKSELVTLHVSNLVEPRLIHR